MSFDPNHLAEALTFLRAIGRLYVEGGASDLEKAQFHVTLVVNQGKMRYPDKPYTHLDLQQIFEGILGQLQEALQQQQHERQWATGEARFGASIDSHMIFLTERLKEAKAAAEKAPMANALHVMNVKLYSGVILRLRELKERRAVGGVHNEWEDMRDKARRAWMEYEFEAPKREEEQRRQRERKVGPDYTDPFEAAPKYFGDRLPWYEVLGVPADATRAQIQKAYRMLVKLHQPRTVADSENPERTKRMADINTARDEGLARL